MTPTTLLTFVIWFIIAGVVYWLIMWAVDTIGVPEPFNKVIKVVVILVALIFVINALLSLFGSPFIRLR